jgi:uncharacterized membrane protein
VQFTQPLYLLLFLPLIAGLVYSWKHVHGMTKGRKAVSFGLRFAMIALIILALAGAQSRRENDGVGTVFVVDLSDSVREGDRESARSFIQDALESRSDEDAAGVVVFGSEASVEVLPGSVRELGQFQSVVPGEQSNLASALRLASAIGPEGKGRRIVVVSDGNETEGDARQAAEVAGADGTVVDYVPMGREREEPEVTLVDLQTPGERQAGEPLQARVVLDSNMAQEAVLRVERNGELISNEVVALTEGTNAFLVEDRLPEPGFYRYRATVQARSDGDVRNNLGSAFTAVRGKPVILVLQEEVSRSVLAEALRQQGFEVELRGPGGIPVRAEEVQPYEAVLLNDINAQHFTGGQMDLLRAAVRDSGVGLAMIGGENSFLSGGWYGTSVAEALPVDLNIRQRKRFPSTSVLIAVDASGSMGAPVAGGTKLQLAARAAERTVDLLSPIDRVGVAGSSDGFRLVAPIQPLDDKPTVKAQIRRLRPGAGGIFAEMTVQHAKRELEREDTRVRHFIMLADGADTDQYGSSLDMAREMRENRITTSVVAIGDGPHVPFLQLLADAGGGNFYLAERAEQLPAIFTQDVAVMSRSAIEEGAFVPKLSPAELILQGFLGEGVPPLLAYNLTEDRPLAQVGMLTHKDDPLLAHWQFGLGQSLAFTSDAQPRWAVRWVPWSGFGRFWAQSVRGIARRAAENGYEIEVSPEGAVAQVSISAVDEAGQPISLDVNEVTVSRPDGSSEQVGLRQVAPGRYEGRFMTEQLGSYIVSVAEGQGEMVGVASAGYSLAYPPEYRSFEANLPLLEEISQATGGRRLERPQDVWRELPNPGETIQDLWRTLLLAACLLLPFDVAVRRLAVSPADVWNWIRRKREGGSREATESLGRLRKAKERVTEPGGTVKRPSGEPTPRPVFIRDRASASTVETTTKPAAGEGAGEGSTASALLRKKRERQQDSDPRK